MGAEALGLDPEDCVVFEDSINGIKAANTGGFTSIGVGDEHTLREASFILPNLEGCTIAVIEEKVAQHK